MTGLIFAFMQAYEGDERESLLLAHSLRTFGGKLAKHPLWLMLPENPAAISATTLRELEKLGVQVYRFEVPEEALKFPFGGKVYAAAAAEEMASNQADILVWMDSDTVFTGDPTQLLLGENVNLGYRPVMLKNISSLYDDPVNKFWELIYNSCETSEEDMPLMLTTVDKMRIRPQYNAGLLSIRPKLGLLQTWRENFERIYQQPEFLPFYQEHILYRIFVHQAILSATLLAKLKRDEMQDLGPHYNQPTFLDIDAVLIQEAITLRYDQFKFFEEPGWEKKVDLKVSIKDWLRAETGENRL